MASSATERLVCPRCQRELVSTTQPSDAGIALESFDCSPVNDQGPPIDWAAQEKSRQRLREIDRKLNTSYRRDAANPTLHGLHRPPSAVPPPLEFNHEVPLRSVARRAASDHENPHRRTSTSWMLSLLLGAGVFAFAAGIGSLAWSAAFELPQLWQQGMTLTIGAEGLLILSLTWMAVRLWRNGRRVNTQLHGVDRQLAEIEQVTGSLAGQQASSSQHFYHHFGQAASSHMLVANLQGQVDLMSARLASEGGVKM